MKKWSLAVLFLLIGLLAAQAQVAINTDDSSAVSGSILHVKGDATSTNIILQPGTGGGVGIGTNAPAAKLDVDGVALSKFEGFSYYVSGLNVSAGGWIDVVIPTLDYDTFATEPYNITAGTFTAPRAGYYRFSIFGYATTHMSAVGDRYAFGVDINGNLKSFAGGNYSTADTPLTAYSAVVYLSSGDMVNPTIFSSIDVTLGGGQGMNSGSKANLWESNRS